LRSLRSRLILSHILPLLIIVPITYLALVYLLETRFLFPQLAEDLLGDAKLLAEITRAQYYTFGRTSDLQFFLLRMELNPDMRLVYLSPDGEILYSNDADFLARTNEKLIHPGLEQARYGNEVIISNYTFLTGGDYAIQVMLPVKVFDDSIVGILWMTYFETSITNLIQQMRQLSVYIMLGCLILGTILGTILALSISRPVRQVTFAIQDLARGDRSGQLSEKGPQEVRELARSVNLLVERLRNMEQSRRHLLANLVHELGRPLGALRSAIQALAKGAGTDEQLLHDLTTGMDEETARLQKILEELAHLHDQVLGSLELQRESLDLSEWLPKVLLPWQEAASQKRLQWKSELSQDIPNVILDSRRLAQIIGNLVSNAIKYTPPGRSVSVAAGTQDNLIWISVSDTGPGISPEEQERIFTPFYRGGQGQRIKQGMGLGLSIASDLTVAHGGQLEVESTPGFGSKFTVWLPIRSL